MRYFITGATGFVGAHVAERLLARGDQVTALVRDPSRAQTLAEKGAQLLQGDLADKESMRPGMQGADGVFHIAGWYKVGDRDRETAYTVNVDGTRNVLELMQEFSIPKGVYTSSLAVNSDTRGVMVDEEYRFEGEHLSLYDKTKWIAHHEVAEPMIEAGLPLVIVQPGLIYGPGDTGPSAAYIRQYLRRELPMLPSKTAVCWTHVEDAARGHLLAMDRGEPGESYIIAGPCHTFIEAFEMAEEITGIPAPGIHVPPWLPSLLSIPMRVIDRWISLPPAYTEEGLRVIAGVTYLGTNEKARRELGYEPRSLEEGFRQSLPAYRAQVG